MKISSTKFTLCISPQTTTCFPKHMQGEPLFTLKQSICRGGWAGPMCPYRSPRPSPRPLPRPQALEGHQGAPPPTHWPAATSQALKTVGGRQGNCRLGASYFYCSCSHRKRFQSRAAVAGVTGKCSSCCHPSPRFWRKGDSSRGWESALSGLCLSTGWKERSCLLPPSPPHFWMLHKCFQSEVGGQESTLQGGGRQSECKRQTLQGHPPLEDECSFLQ